MVEKRTIIKIIFNYCLGVHKMCPYAIAKALLDSGPEGANVERFH
jgi:hypothetical protein